MKVNFILRVYNAPFEWFKELNVITISGITILSKDGKYGECHYKGNQKKFGYTVEMPKKFLKGGGSHSYPELTFKWEFIDIIIKNFPRYPVFGQCKYHARNVLNGSTGNDSNNGFPDWLLKNKVEFLNVKP